MSDHIALPPKVAAAIVAVMGDVPKLAKGEKNSHGNYNFASIDDFLEATRPLCAKHGLIILQNEESFEMKEGWLIVRFSFTLAHCSGETWGERQVRTIMVSSKMGAQAFGTAQSYTLKQYMRALFQIATGEKGNDADEHPGADLPTISPRSDGATREKTAKDADWRGPLNKTSLKSALRAIQNDVENATDEASLDDIVKAGRAAIDQAKHDLPEWIDGDGGDIRGLRPTVEMMRAELRSRESMKEGFTA